MLMLMDKDGGKRQDLSISSLSLYIDSPKARLGGKKGILHPIPTLPNNFNTKAAAEKAKLECHKMVPPALRDASAVYPGTAPRAAPRAARCKVIPLTHGQQPVGSETPNLLLLQSTSQCPCLNLEGRLEN